MINTLFETESPVRRPGARRSRHAQPRRADAAGRSADSSAVATGRTWTRSTFHDSCRHQLISAGKGFGDGFPFGAPSSWDGEIGSACRLPRHAPCSIPLRATGPSWRGASVVGDPRGRGGRRRSDERDVRHQAFCTRSTGSCAAGNPPSPYSHRSRRRHLSGTIALTGRAKYTFQPDGVDADGVSNVLVLPRRKERACT